MYIVESFVICFIRMIDDYTKFHTKKYIIVPNITPKIWIQYVHKLWKYFFCGSMYMNMHFQNRLNEKRPSFSLIILLIIAWVGRSWLCCCSFGGWFEKDIILCTHSSFLLCSWGVILGCEGDSLVHF